MQHVAVLDDVFLAFDPVHALLARRRAAGARSVRASLHAANALTIQSDFRSAIEWVDRVAAIDPDNADARELRRTIQFASAAAGGWGWGPARQ